MKTKKLRVIFLAIVLVCAFLLTIQNVRHSFSLGQRDVDDQSRIIGNGNHFDQSTARDSKKGAATGGKKKKRQSGTTRLQKADDKLLKSLTGLASRPAGSSSSPAVQDDNPFQILLDGVKEQKDILKQKLLDIYGDKYYWDIFEPIDANTSTTTTPAASSNKRIGVGDHYFYKSPSFLQNSLPKHEKQHNPTSERMGWNRMVRKIQLKLLQSQLPQKTNNATTRLRWMTAGNGPASGAGNLFRETFTSVLEDAAGPIFQAAGIPFTTQNYAIQAMSSGDEVALCSTELYGRGDQNDYDIMFWDFDMTDEQDYWKLAMFASRTMALDVTTSPSADPKRSRPALMANQRTKGHASVLVRLEQAGIAVLGRDTKAQGQQNKACPDSSRLSKDEREALPPHLQYIRCGKEMEEGGPKTYDDIVDGKKMCRGYKFNPDVCPNRPRQYIWHPGWRVNAIKGYTLALTLTELLEDAVESLINSMGNMQEQLETLETNEQADHESFLATNRASLLPTKWVAKEESQDIHDHIDLESLFRLPALCRTALLPSKSRLLQREDLRNAGSTKLLTNSYNETFEMGVMANRLRKFESNQGNDGGYRYKDESRRNDMVIITDKADYLDDPSCTEELVFSHQDAFIVTSSQNWRSITLPSEAELRYNQAYDVSSAKGWIFMCLFTCNDSKCSPQDLHDRIYNKEPRKEAKSSLQGLGDLEMTINDVPVTKYDTLIKTRYSHLDGCLGMGHDNDAESSKSEYTWKADGNGKYVVTARIANATRWSYFKISSLILM